MNFEELNDTIPYCVGGKEKVLRYSPYPNITLAMPGRHAKDTTPKGGDFVVMVADPMWANPEHQFKHDDIFQQIELYRETSTDEVVEVMESYLAIVKGADPTNYVETVRDSYDDMIDLMSPPTLFYALQCLAVAEHRRYAQYENKYGGRYLPFRFSAGIAEGLWTAEAAISVQRKGRPGVEWLEKDNGVPKLTQELMNGT